MILECHGYEIPAALCFRSVTLVKIDEAFVDALVVVFGIYRVALSPGRVFKTGLTPNSLKPVAFVS